MYSLLTVPYHDRNGDQDSHKKDNPCPVSGWHSLMYCCRANYYAEGEVSNNLALQSGCRGRCKSAARDMNAESVGKPGWRMAVKGVMANRIYNDNTIMPAICHPSSVIHHLLL
jgi:hypothetical protein